MMWQKTFLAKKENKELTIVFLDMNLGGIQRKIVDLISYLQKNNSDIKITLYLRNKKGIFLERVPDNVIIKFPKIHMPQLDMVWFVFWLVGRLIKDRPKTILSFIDVGSIPILIANKIVFWIKPKIIIGEDTVTSKNIRTETIPKIRLWLIKKTYPMAEKILVQTKIQSNDLVEILGERYKSKIIVSPNWLPLDFSQKKINLKNKRDIDILFVGRIEPQKNPIKFIEIVKLLSLSNPNLTVKMIGQGSLLKEVEKMVEKMSLKKNVSFCPTTNDPAKYYNRAKIFLLTSNYEGFPLTLMEAISCGCQPIISNMPETNLFFDKYKNKIVFKNKKNAVKIIEKALIERDEQLILYYGQKIVDKQSINIAKYAGYLVN